MRLYLSSYRNGSNPEELLKLLGKGRRTAYISNAMDSVDAEERTQSDAENIERLKALGLEPTTIDLRDYFGTPNDLEKALTGFDLIWAKGGNVFVLMRAFQQSGADKVITKLLKEDKVVYGGSSAGIIVLCSSLRGIDIVDDPNVVPEGYEPAVPWQGLGLLPKLIVPHFKSNHPESAAIARTVEFLERKNLPFITLRDGEALVVNGNEQKIVGSPLAGAQT